MTDKEWVIISLTIIAVCSLVLLKSESVITAIVSGLCGIAVGKAL